MNRGSREHVQRETGDDDASMRPRFMNRGSPARAGRREGPAARFNEAPIHESGKLRQALLTS